MIPGLLLVSVLALPAAQGRREPASFDLRGYVAEVDSVRRAIASAGTPDNARAIAAAIPDRWWVDAGGNIIVVDTGWIDRAIPAAGSEWPAIRAGIERRLTAMIEFAQDEPGGEQSAAAVLQAVLARPEFSRGETSRWLEGLRERIGAWLLRILNWFRPSAATGRTAATVFAWAVALAALVALSFWLVTFLLRRSPAASLELSDAVPDPGSSRQWALQALDAARAGDIRTAVRCGYRAAVCRLDEQGVWTLDDARTPREYLSLLTGDDPRHDIVADLTRQFEQVWYGRRTATREDADRVTTHLEHLGCLAGSERAI